MRATPNADYWRRKRVLVTGATGFIGANLAGELLRLGATVVTFERDRNPFSSLRALGLHDRVLVVQGDICDLDLAERVLNEKEIDHVFHLAAQALVGPAGTSPLSTFESNIRGSWIQLEAARRRGGLQSFVVASSDKAYGVQTDLPYDESFRLNGRYPYDASKACTDILAQSFYETYDLPIAITRNANTYGPGDLNFSRLIPESIRAALEGRPVEIRSDGKMQRDFLYIEDAVEGYLLLAEAIATGKLRGEAFNFGSGEPRTVLEVCQLILETVGGEQSEPDVLNVAKYEIPAQYLNTTRAKNMWGWEATTSLEDGLARSVSWYREFLPTVP